MLAQFAKVAPIILLAQVFIIAGVFFIGGLLWPSGLSRVYEAFGPPGRTVIAAVFFFAFGNFLCGWCMQHFSPAVVSPVMIAGAILIQILFTILCAGYRPSLWIVPATALVLAGGVWVSVLLGRSV